MNKILLIKKALFFIYKIINSNSCFLVYQPGKVGSSTINHSIIKAGFLLFHIHRLNPIHLAEYKVNVYRKFSLPDIMIYKWRKDILRIKLKKNKRLKIITAIRDPIAFNVSSYFQNIQFFIPDINNRITMGEEIPFEELEKNFINNFDHEYILKWFKHELLAVFGIDITTYPFDRDKGYAIYSDNNIQLFVYKVEKLNEIWDKASYEYFRVKNMFIENKYLSKEKFYGKLYIDFLKKITLNEDYIQNLYDTPLIKHFYTEEEISSFRRKWIGPAHLK